MGALIGILDRVADAASEAAQALKRREVSRADVELAELRLIVGALSGTGAELAELRAAVSVLSGQVETLWTWHRHGRDYAAHYADEGGHTLCACSGCGAYSAVPDGAGKEGLCLYCQTHCSEGA